MFPAPEYSCTIDGFDFILVAHPGEIGTFMARNTRHFLR